MCIYNPCIVLNAACLRWCASGLREHARSLCTRPDNHWFVEPSCLSVYSQPPVQSSSTCPDGLACTGQRRTAHPSPATSAETCCGASLSRACAAKVCLAGWGRRIPCYFSHMGVHPACSVQVQLPLPMLQEPRPQLHWHRQTLAATKVTSNLAMLCMNNKLPISLHCLFSLARHQNGGASCHILQTYIFILDKNTRVTPPKACDARTSPPTDYKPT